MLQDSIWANGARLADDPYQDTPSVRRGVHRGLGVLPRQPRGVQPIRPRAAAQIGAGHQLWMMNEVNKLIWPSPAGFGKADGTSRVARPSRSPSSRRTPMGRAFLTAELDGGRAHE